MADTTTGTGLPESRGTFLTHGGSRERLKITRAACQTGARPSHVLKGARGARSNLGLSRARDIRTHPTQFALASSLVQCERSTRAAETDPSPALNRVHSTGAWGARAVFIQKRTRVAGMCTRYQEKTSHGIERPNAPLCHSAHNTYNTHTRIPMSLIRSQTSKKYLFFRM